MLEVQQLFKRQFAFHPTWEVSVPARVELLGHHQHFIEGLTLSLAVDKYLHIAASPRDDGRVHLVSSLFPDVETFSISNLEKGRGALWADYVKAVLAQLRKRDVHFGGFNAAIHTAIPVGIGLGSSSALSIATALIVRELHPYRVTDAGTLVPPRRDRRGRLPDLTGKEKMSIARLCRSAEEYVRDFPSNLMDTATPLVAREFSALELDCQHQTVEHHPLTGDFMLVICPSGVEQDGVAESRERLRMHCNLAARGLGVRVLRSVDPPFLLNNRWRLKQREHQCAFHVVGEIQRVLFGERALRNGDLDQFGDYLYQSHASARDSMRSTVKEVDLLVELARKIPGCFGARMMGNGFGGSTLNLVLTEQVKPFMVTVAAEYREQTGRTLEPIMCRSVAGVG